MSGIVYFIPIIYWILFLIWFITCTKHEDFPWIVHVIISCIMFVPILNWILIIVATIAILILWWAGDLPDSYEILKDNWFNRFFLGYRDE